MNPVVRSGHACPRCEKDDAFITWIELGGRREMVPHKGAACTECLYTLSHEEEKEMLDKAEGEAPSDYAGEYADYLYDRSRDR